MCTIDDDGVGIGDVEAALDDGCGDEDIVVVVHEIDHYLLQLIRRHLAIGHGNVGIGDMFAHKLCKLGQLADAVVDEEHLPTSAHLKLNGFGDDGGIEGTQLCLNGIAVGRRRLDDTQVASSHQGELEGARYRCGCQGEGVDVGLQLAKLLFGGDAELLFLVDDEESQVLELHSLADEFVCADDDVDGAVLQLLEYSLGLLRGAGTCQVFYLDGEVLEAARECLEVLVGEHGGGHEDSHLLVVDASLERSPDGHLRLAEAHVAADKAVHGALPLHVSFHVGSCLELVGRVLIEETCFQLMLHEAVAAVGKPLLLSATRVEQDEVASDVLNLLLRPLLHAFPSPCAEMADARWLTLLAFVLGNLVQGMDGDIDAVVARVDYLDDLLHLVAVLHAHKAAEPPHAIVHVHHVVAQLELLQLLQRQRHLAAHGTFAAQVVLVVAVEYLMVGEKGHVQVVVAEAAVEGAVHGREADAGLLVLEDVLQAVGLLLAVGKDIEGRALVLQMLEGIDEQVEVLVEDGLRMGVEGDADAAPASTRLLRGQSVAPQLNAPEVKYLFPECLGLHQQGVGRQWFIIG